MEKEGKNREANRKGTPNGKNKRSESTSCTGHYKSKEMGRNNPTKATLEKKTRTGMLIAWVGDRT